MAPRITPLIPLALDKPRHLRLTKVAIFEAERAMCRLWGKQVNILMIFSEGGLLTLNDLSILLHQGLLHEDPTLTLAEVQEMMDFDRLPAIMTAVLDAWNAATQSADPHAPAGGTTPDGPLSLSPGEPSGLSLVSN